MRSETCSPSGSMISSHSPRFTIRAAPVCGSRCTWRRSVMRRYSRRPSMERAAPRAFRCVAAGVLFRLRPLAEVREARVDAALEGNVASANQVPQPLEMPLTTEAFELRMRVENERRIPEAACQPGAHRMESHDEERSSGEAE